MNYLNAKRSIDDSEILMESIANSINYAKSQTPAWDHSQFMDVERHAKQLVQSLKALKESFESVAEVKKAEVQNQAMDAAIDILNKARVGR